jgi:hypothetical protein
MFENAKGFSNLSAEERILSFHSEQAFYYVFYAQSLERLHAHNTWSAGLRDVFTVGYYFFFKKKSPSIVPSCLIAVACVESGHGVSCNNQCHPAVQHLP